MLVRSYRTLSPSHHKDAICSLLHYAVGSHRLTVSQHHYPMECGLSSVGSLPHRDFLAYPHHYYTCLTHPTTIEIPNSIIFFTLRKLGTRLIRLKVKLSLFFSRTSRLMSLLLGIVGKRNGASENFYLHRYATQRGSFANSFQWTYPQKLDNSFEPLS